MDHTISIHNLSKDKIDHILSTAMIMEPIAKREKNSNILKNKILALLFFEPSTRTRMSFETAMLRLGGQVMNLGSVDRCSVAKGETLADTIRIVSTYADAIVLRHPSEGAALMASTFSTVPIINAGDGAGQHPSQTLLDLYTIKRESHLENLTITLAGDLKYGRTIHSLCYALSLYDANINLVSPKELPLPTKIIDELIRKGISITHFSSLEESIKNSDILYMTRIQKERFPDVSEYTNISKKMRITIDLLENCNPNLKILHPLPRVDEIDYHIDSTKYACYFKQAFYGLPIRMAILSLLMMEENL